MDLWMTQMISKNTSVGFAIKGLRAKSIDFLPYEAMLVQLILEPMAHNHPTITSQNRLCGCPCRKNAFKTNPFATSAIDLGRVPIPKITSLLEEFSGGENFQKGVPNEDGCRRFSIPKSPNLKYKTCTNSPCVFD